MPVGNTSGKRTDRTFSGVLDAYEHSPNFTKNEPSTQANYRRILRWAHAALGFLSIDEIRPSIVQAALDELAETPAAQFNARAVLSAVDKWAMVRELLPRQITMGTSVPGTTDGHQPWSDAQVDLVERSARADLARVVTLMVHTGQRGSDVVRMRLSDIEEHDDPATGRRHPGINVIQQKTKIRLWVPFTHGLIAAIESWRRDIRPPWLLVTKRDGTPYTRPQLSWNWNNERDKNPALAAIKEEGLTLHGLRATCVVRLRKAGATPLQIASMVGMSDTMVWRYSRLADQTDMALAAVHYLNPRTSEERKLAEKAEK